MYVEGVESGVCGFTQHCIQSTVTHVGGVKGYCTLYTVASCPSQEGRLFKPSILGV